MYQQFVADNQHDDGPRSACAPFGRVNVVVDGQAEIADGVHLVRQLLPGARRDRAASAGPSCPEDDAPTAPPVAVISSKYWHSRFGTDPAVVGKAIKVNNVPVTIVGVIAAGLHRRAAAGRRSRRTFACRSRSSRSSTHGHRPDRGWPSRPTGGCR